MLNVDAARGATRPRTHSQDVTTHRLGAALHPQVLDACQRCGARLSNRRGRPRAQPQPPYRAHSGIALTRHWRIRSTPAAICTVQIETEEGAVDPAHLAQVSNALRRMSDAHVALCRLMMTARLPTRANPLPRSRGSRLCAVVSSHSHARSSAREPGVNTRCRGRFKRRHSADRPPLFPVAPPDRWTIAQPCLPTRTAAEPRATAANYPNVFSTAPFPPRPRAPFARGWPRWRVLQSTTDPAVFLNLHHALLRLTEPVMAQLESVDMAERQARLQDIFPARLFGCLDDDVDDTDAIGTPNTVPYFGMNRLGGTLSHLRKEAALPPGP